MARSLVVAAALSLITFTHAFAPAVGHLGTQRAFSLPRPGLFGSGNKKAEGGAAAGMGGMAGMMDQVRPRFSPPRQSIPSPLC